MKVFVDSADLNDVSAAAAYGILDGVTTNPSLMAKVGVKGPEAIRAHYGKICDMVEDLVSAEVLSTDFEGMMREASELTTISPKIVIKLPMTPAGVKATKALSERGIRTNVTLVFSPGQAILAAKAGATFISPFLGRLDDISTDGMHLIKTIREIFDVQGFKTEILAASIRHPMHIVECARVGADVVTTPLASIEKLFNHPLTESGLAQFVKDAEKLAVEELI